MGCATVALIVTSLLSFLFFIAIIQATEEIKKLKQEITTLNNIREQHIKLEENIKGKLEAVQHQQVITEQHQILVLVLISLVFVVLYPPQISPN